MAEEQENTPLQDDEQVVTDAVEQADNATLEPDMVGAALDMGAQLEAALQEAAQAKEQALRAAAEAQNSRRRADADVEKARKYALEKFAGDMLPVADNLDRALASADRDNDELKSVIEGVELTYKSLQDALARHGVSQIDPTGEPFDPEFHQAMAMVPNPEVEPNSVL
ncbi:MAG: nucleotide exchange factor GrpE, partial [Spongiibacteraceae bacterium]